MGLDELYIYAGNERLIDLLLLQEAGLLTAAQQQELAVLLQQPEAQGILLMFHIEKSDLSLPEEEQPAPVPGIVRRMPVWRTLAVAASILLAAGGAWWYYSGMQQEQAVVKTRPVVNDVKPGGNKAVLTLANGQQIVLDDASKGSVATEGNTQVIKLSGGELAYQAAKGAAAETEMVYNTITTPRAGQYVVLLPDGSKVWLNAATRLRFPVAFTARERKVEITGEAYFEIVQNARKPFVVTTGRHTVQVLGTNFNISAYPEDKAVSTTLLEGSVRVTNGEGAQYLDPGQQAQSDDAHIALVKQPDIEQVMAWKNGIFRFNESSIEDIMKQLARWYDVEVVYQHPSKPSDLYVGTIPRNVPLSEVLHLLELTGHVQFSIENSSKILVRY